DRLFFVILLTWFLFYFGHRMYKAYAQIIVNGQVMLEKMSVNFTDEIRIKKMMVEEGDEVVAGDSLFSYVVETPGLNRLDKIYNKYDGNNNWFLREKMAVTRQIQLKKSDRQGINTLIQLKKEELEALKKRVYLGSELSHKIEPVKTKIQELENEKSSLTSEINVLYDYLQRLRQQEMLAISMNQKAIEEELAAKSAFESLVLYYTTPITGLIGQIQKQENEVCYQSESVMTIHKLGVIKIKAYFLPEHANDIAIGDEVTVVFEDGSKSKGLVQNFYISTYPMPPEFQKRYEPTTRSIVVDIVPKDEYEAENWLSYYKMSVKVVKSRFKMLQ
ncbi:MAG TPA: HlyD family efflux transporter periplasmic adaptor subunit, partial [Bacteroidetes bacterium]|nr:HlyD family efflux transporter periplasmic adaptor subunit [Bacteroidota bacterium]